MPRVTPTLFSLPLVELTPQERALETSLLRAIRIEETPAGKTASLLPQESLEMFLTEILSTPKQFQLLVSIYLKYQAQPKLPAANLFLRLINLRRLQKFWGHHLEHLTECPFVDQTPFSP